MLFRSPNAPVRYFRAPGGNYTQALVNLVAGATKIRFTDYITGTALGLLPGIVLMSALGARLFHILEHPTAANALVLTGMVLACAGVTWLLQKLASRMRHDA